MSFIRMKWSKLLPSRALTSKMHKGMKGERAARRYLKRELKFKILDKNWRHGKDELDIIARDGEFLVFVEVKARQKGGLTRGYDALNARKKEALLRACKAYLRQKGRDERYFRLDLIEVSLQGEEIGSINHYANIPLFPKQFH